MLDKNDEAARLWKDYKIKKSAKIAPKFFLTLAIIVGLALLAIGVWIII